MPKTPKLITDDIVSLMVTEPPTSNGTWGIYQPEEWRLWHKGEVALRKTDENGRPSGA